MGALFRAFRQATAAGGVLMVANRLRDDTVHRRYLLYSVGHDRPQDRLRSIAIDPYQICLHNPIDHDHPVFEGNHVTTSNAYKLKEKGAKYVKYLDLTPVDERGEEACVDKQVSFSYQLFETNDDFQIYVRSQYYTVHLGKLKDHWWQLKPKVCEGLHIGIEGMKVNGVRRIVVPPELSCRHRKDGRLGCNKSRVFDVTLRRVKGPTHTN